MIYKKLGSSLPVNHIDRARENGPTGSNEPVGLSVASQKSRSYRAPTLSRELQATAGAVRAAVASP